MLGHLAIALLLVALAPPAAPAPQRGRVDLAGEDVAHYPMPQCVSLPSGTRIESGPDLAALGQTRCGGSSLPPVDLERRSLVSVSIAVDCAGWARIDVHRDGVARVVTVHMIRHDGGCRAMTRGGTYWISIPKVPPGHAVVLSRSHTAFQDEGDRPTPEAGAPGVPATPFAAPSRAAAAALVTIETYDSPDLAAEPIAIASGVALRDGRVVTTASAMKWAVAARLRRAGAPNWFRVERVVGLDLHRDVCVLDVPGLDVDPVAMADPPPGPLAARLAAVIAGPDASAPLAVELERVAAVPGLDGALDLRGSIRRPALGAPAFDAAGRLLGIATNEGGRAHVVPVDVLHAPAIATPMAVGAAGFLARTDAEAAGFTAGRVKRVVETVRAEGRPDRVTETHYDHRGMRTRVVATIDDHARETELTYDARGLVTHVTHRDSEWRAASRGEDLDEAEALAEAARYEGPIRTTERLEDGGTIVRDLDRAGRVTREWELDASNRLLVETVHTHQYGLLVRATRSQVDARGMRTLERELLFTYDADRLGHWTRRSTRERRAGQKAPGEPIEIATRSIAYHQD